MDKSITEYIATRLSRMHSRRSYFFIFFANEKNFKNFLFFWNIWLSLCRGIYGSEKNATTTIEYAGQ